MLFENINQFKKAKSLLEKNQELEEVFINLRNDTEFQKMSDIELRFAIQKVQEGLGERILNAASKIVGGDVSKIDTVLAQMKDQELKFNREENGIYVEFSNLIEKKNELMRAKDNPDYSSSMRDVKQAMDALNTRMDELTKSHEKIFSSLEEKIRSLTGKNDRKRKYFNTKRASDVLITQTDRYEKIKALTQKSVDKANSIEKFFGLDIDEIEDDVEKAKKEAEKNLNAILAVAKKLDQDPEKGFYEKFILISNSNEKNPIKKSTIKDLIKDVDNIIHSIDFDTYDEDRKDDIINFLFSMKKEVNNLDKKIYRS